MARLTSILFDVDDTLFSTTEFAARARRNAVRAMVAAGLDLPEDLVLRELQEVIFEFSSNYGHHFDRLLQRLKPHGLDGTNPAIVVAAGIVAYHNTKYEQLAPFDDVVPLLEALRDAGVQTGVITHGWTAKQAEKLVRLGLTEHFDPRAIFISDQVGISKPNPKLYAHVLRELGRQPQEVAYVGDNPSHDIAPPQSLGMVAIWAKRSAKHRCEPGLVPDHTVDDFTELAELLRTRFEIPIRST
ncbi:MAG TPA: TIGR02253 family HAD-type hydrolase [Planctomycetes bacterium]|nr:TIGR02253 family HAD-type hydrolase [Planctomycetota bacterium]